MSRPAMPLTDEQIAHIRESATSGGILARIYQVSPATISKIRNGLSHKDPAKGAPQCRNRLARYPASFAGLFSASSFS